MSASDVSRLEGAIWDRQREYRMDAPGVSLRRQVNWYKGRECIEGHFQETKRRAPLFPTRNMQDVIDRSINRDCLTSPTVAIVQSVALRLSDWTSVLFSCWGTRQITQHSLDAESPKDTVMVNREVDTTTRDPCS